MRSKKMDGRQWTESMEREGVRKMKIAGNIEAKRER